MSNKIITVEGYKAFRGKLKVSPKIEKVKPFLVEGDFIYKPDTGCWYGRGCSYAADICEIVEVQYA